MSGKPAIEMSAAQAAGRIRRQVADDLAALRVDAGLSQAAVGRAARLHPSSVGRIEAGHVEPDLDTLCRLATVLGCEVSVKLFPAGVPLRDRFQAPILETFLALPHATWRRSVEVPVAGTVAGVIDCVLVHPRWPLLLAVEVHSEIRRAEAVLRRASDKAEALRRSPLGARVAPRAAAGIETSRVLVLRSTVANRAVVRDLAQTFAAAYPARTADALAALRDPATPWPGPAIIWVHLHGSRATVMDRPPRTVLLGR
jgi:transcriptional regulator with XRE-family HTH domain